MLLGAILVGEKVFEEPAPAGGIVAGPHPVRSRIVRHQLDSVADAARAFRDARPDGLQDGEDARGVDIRDGEIADMGEDVLLEAPSPLLTGAITAPAGLVLGDVGYGALPKRRRLRPRGHLLAFRAAFGSTPLKRCRWASQAFWRAS
jgi:hypothetical protein